MTLGSAVTSAINDISTSPNRPAPTSNLVTRSPLAPVYNPSDNELSDPSETPVLLVGEELTVLEAIVKIRASLNEGEILDTAVQILRQLMGVDRVCILQFERTTLGSPGQFVAESVSALWRSLLGTRLEHPEQQLGFIVPSAQTAQTLCWDGKQLRQTQTIVNDVAAANLSPTQRGFITDFCQAQAFLSIPLVRQNQLWGGLYLYHCDGPHDWTIDELNQFYQVVEQLAIALEHSSQLQQANRQALQALQQLGQLKQAQAQLIHSEKMSGLGHLVAGIAHEINNPVSFIYGNLVHTGNYATTLLELIGKYHEMYPESELSEYLEEIDFNFIEMDFPKILNSMKTGTDRIRKLVLSLRNFSRLDEADIKTVDIHEGIDNTLMVLRHRFVNRDCLPAVTLRKHYGDLPPVTCYPSQMNQVFLHLITNSIDAFDRHRKQAPYVPLMEITTTRLDGDRIAITVKDNGPGIPQDIQRKIFDTFFTTKPPGQGTGLGLAISHHVVVEQHGGELICISEPGWGSFFQAIIPLAPPGIKPEDSAKV